jgi:hypothetical protein
MLTGREENRIEEAKILSDFSHGYEFVLMKDLSCQQLSHCRFALIT